METLLWLESLRSPLLTGFFTAVTFLGSEDFLLLVLPVVYWCVNRTLGLRLVAVLLGSAFLNDVLKEWVAEARPGPPAHPLATDTAPGKAWPSGHAQDAAALWGTLAGQLRRGWAWAAALIVIALIGVSRLYLAVHWPIDVL
ncbi:MAG TPA: phosphatase PAP2 family protein, partial [Chloroflexia bacterium]|nr:phosphatase PAP2 family protein [Chloroflexia bacterium]